MLRNARLVTDTSMMTMTCTAIINANVTQLRGDSAASSATAACAE
jgi:hypothetical protein